MKTSELTPIIRDSSERPPIEGETMGVLDYEITGGFAVREALLCRSSETGELGIIERKYDIGDNNTRYAFKAVNDVEVDSSEGQKHSITSPVTLVEDGAPGKELGTVGSSGIHHPGRSDRLPTSSVTEVRSAGLLRPPDEHNESMARSDGDGDRIRMPRGVTVSTGDLEERDARFVPSEEDINGLLPLHSRNDKKSARFIIEKLMNYGLGSELPQVEPNQVIRWSARCSRAILPTELKRVILHSSDDSKPSTLTAVGKSNNYPELGITVSPRGRRGLEIAISNGSEIVLIRKGFLGTRLKASGHNASALLEEATSILFDTYCGVAAGAIRSALSPDDLDVS